MDEDDIVQDMILMDDVEDVINDEFTELNIALEEDTEGSKLVMISPQTPADPNSGAGAELRGFLNSWPEKNLSIKFVKNFVSAFLKDDSLTVQTPVMDATSRATVHKVSLSRDLKSKSYVAAKNRDNLKYMILRKIESENSKNKKSRDAIKQGMISNVDVPEQWSHLCLLFKEHGSVIQKWVKETGRVSVYHPETEEEFLVQREMMIHTRDKMQKDKKETEVDGGMYNCPCCCKPRNVEAGVLPIYKIENQVLCALRKRGCVIVKASTGSGKSTQIPQIQAGKGNYKRMIISQPRRQATKSVAERVAAERGFELKSEKNKVDDVVVDEMSMYVEGKEEEGDVDIAPLEDGEEDAGKVDKKKKTKKNKKKVAEEGESSPTVDTNKCDVGYMMRHERVNETAPILFTTSGTLLQVMTGRTGKVPDIVREWCNERFTQGTDAYNAFETVLTRIYHSTKSVDVIILDEVHERDQFVDMALLLCRFARVIKPSLKLVLMSASVNTSEISQYFEAPTIDIHVDMHPVGVFHLEDIWIRNKHQYLNNPVLLKEKTKMKKTLEQCEVLECDRRNSDSKECHVQCKCNVDKYSKDLCTSLYVLEAANNLGTVLQMLLPSVVEIVKIESARIQNGDFAEEEQIEVTKQQNEESAFDLTALLHEMTKVVGSSGPIFQLPMISPPVSFVNNDVSKVISDEISIETKETHESKETIGSSKLPFHNHVTSGSVLVFLPGWLEIAMYQAAINEAGLSNVDIVTLHSAVTYEEQRRAFTPLAPNMLRVILATNIAETSLTLPDVYLVLDMCMCKRFELENNVSKFTLTRVSKSEMQQRKGRTGRVAPGNVVRMVSRRTSSLLAAHVLPEILRVPLENSLLTFMSQSRNTSQNTTLLLQMQPTPPSVDQLQYAVKRLELQQLLYPESHAIKKKQGSLTDLGRCVIRMQATPQEGVLLLRGYALGCYDQALSMSCAGEIRGSIFPLLSAPVDRNAMLSYTGTTCARSAPLLLLEFCNALNSKDRITLLRADVKRSSFRDYIVAKKRALGMYKGLLTESAGLRQSDSAQMLLPDGYNERLLTNKYYARCFEESIRNNKITRVNRKSVVGASTQIPSCVLVSNRTISISGLMPLLSHPNIGATSKKFCITRTGTTALVKGALEAPNNKRIVSYGGIVDIRDTLCVTGCTYSSQLCAAMTLPFVSPAPRLDNNSQVHICEPAFLTSMQYMSAYQPKQSLQSIDEFKEVLDCMKQHFINAMQTLTKKNHTEITLLQTKVSITLEQEENTWVYNARTKVGEQTPLHFKLPLNTKDRNQARTNLIKYYEEMLAMKDRTLVLDEHLTLQAPETHIALLTCVRLAVNAFVAARTDLLYPNTTHSPKELVPFFNLLAYIAELQVNTN